MSRHKLIASSLAGLLMLGLAACETPADLDEGLIEDDTVEDDDDF